MNAVEFVTDLSDLTLPEEVAGQLPASERARIIILTELDGEDAIWRNSAYQQFLCDDSAEDAIYKDAAL